MQDAQILHGKLSAFAQMSDFLREFRFQITTFLRKFEPEGAGKKLIPQGLKEDLWIWKKVINTSRMGLPLAETFEAPPPYSGSWLENPVLDWTLPLKILNDVKSLCDK